MLIKKFLHSCILVEDHGKRLLFDPGMFSFIEKKITTKDIGPVDVIILTHNHPDHLFPEALKELIAMKKPIVVANHEIVELLKKEGIEGQSIHHGETQEVDGFTIEAFEAPHGRLPVECPHNLAFRINKVLAHPGDSFTVSSLKHAEILALPIAGPWATLSDALEFAALLRPKHVIPIHDGIIKDFMLERMYERMCRPYLENLGIQFHPLGLGEAVEFEREGVIHEMAGSWNDKTDGITQVKEIRKGWIERTKRFGI